MQKNNICLLSFDITNRKDKILFDIVKHNYYIKYDKEKEVNIKRIK